jgi:hypothetical protein
MSVHPCAGAADARADRWPGTLQRLVLDPNRYKDLTKYYYDPGTGWLFFYVAQQDPNPDGPSPIASCGGDTKDPACPNNANGETYYVCPPEAGQ